MAGFTVAAVSSIFFCVVVVQKLCLEEMSLEGRVMEQEAALILVLFIIAVEFVLSTRMDGFTADTLGREKDRGRENVLLAMVLTLTLTVILCYGKSRRKRIYLVRAKVPAKSERKSGFLQVKEGKTRRLRIGSFFFCFYYVRKEHATLRFFCSLFMAEFLPMK